MLPERKKHRLDKDVYSRPGAYFITVCVKDRKPILSAIAGTDDHIGPQVRLSKIGQIVDKYTRSIPGIGCYVIMPNHVHMILHISTGGPMWSSGGPMWSSAPTEGIAGGPMWSSGGPMWSSAPTGMNVQNLIRTWKTMITKELGESLWQRGYYDHVIRNEQAYVKIAEYIIANPGKWAEDKYYSSSPV